jgi:hypothetical protein
MFDAGGTNGGGGGGVAHVGREAWREIDRQVRRLA